MALRSPLISSLLLGLLPLLIDTHDLRIVDQLLQHPGDGVARFVLELGPRRLRIRSASDHDTSNLTCTAKSEPRSPLRSGGVTHTRQPG